MPSEKWRTQACRAPRTRTSSTCARRRPRARSELAAGRRRRTAWQTPLRDSLPGAARAARVRILIHVRASDQRRSRADTVLQRRLQFSSEATSRSSPALARRTRRPRRANDARRPSRRSARRVCRTVSAAARGSAFDQTHGVMLIVIVMADLAVRPDGESQMSDIAIIDDE